MSKSKTRYDEVSNILWEDISRRGIGWCDYMEDGLWRTAARWEDHELEWVEHVAQSEAAEDAATAAEIDAAAESE